MDRWQKIVKALITSLIAIVLVFSLISCNNWGGDRFPKTDNQQPVTTKPGVRNTSSVQLVETISEVSPPEVIQKLRQALEIYQPQVKILSPQPDEVLSNNTVEAQFQVQDLPIFKNSELELGPHLHVILDNQPYIANYDLSQPLVLSDLTPGTHTLRVFASRPWHESFKNEGAYAQTTFHIFTKTDDNNPDAAQPLLTYSRPKGSYGEEPILLDFYLTNAPLHLVAQENSKDGIADWRIRCTINGSSFVIDRWEPLYLKGFKPGKNWVQLEFLDEQGNPVKNVFNNTARVINYEPNGKDTLSKLIRGELSADAARGIVDPNYTAIPSAIPTQSLPTTPNPTPSPEPAIVAPPAVETTPESQHREEAATQVEPKETQTTTKESKNLEQQKSKPFFSRLRRPTATPPTLPEAIETPAPQSTSPDVIPQVEISPEPQPLTPEEKILPELESPPITQSEPQKFKQPEIQKPRGFFNRFRRFEVPSSPVPSMPETIEPSASELVPPEAVAPEIAPSTNTTQQLDNTDTDLESDAQPKLDIKEIFLP